MKAIFATIFITSASFFHSTCKQVRPISSGSGSSSLAQTETGRVTLQDLFNRQDAECNTKQEAQENLDPEAHEGVVSGAQERAKQETKLDSEWEKQNLVEVEATRAAAEEEARKRTEKKTYNSAGMKAKRAAQKCGNYFGACFGWNKNNTPKKEERQESKTKPNRSLNQKVWGMFSKSSSPGPKASRK